VCMCLGEICKIRTDSIAKYSEKFAKKANTKKKRQSKGFKKSKEKGMIDIKKERE